MHTTRPHGSLRILALLLVGAAVAALAGCAGGGRTGSRAAIVIDGDISEWPTDVVAMADADYLYLRFRIAGPLTSLQSSPETLSILLDADDSPRTGSPISELTSASSMGIDLEIQFSPMTDSGRPAQGVAAIAIDSTGATERLSHADLDFHFAPTYASDWYEARISRLPTGSGLLPPDILRGRSARGVLGLYDASGTITGTSEPFVVRMPPAASGPRVSDAPIPPTPRGAIRVVSFNVERAAPMGNPAPFIRILRALNPDILLVQEWDSDAASIRNWFDTAFPEHAPWSVATVPGMLGVGVVSRYPITASTADGTLGPSIERIGGSTVRFVAAVVSTPIGDVLVGSTHLKCCGSAGSSEDVRRMAEVGLIGAAFRAMATRPLAMRVLGGDLNLVGSRGPIDALREGLDADGSDLAIAPAMVLGDAAHYTWSEAASPFSPGRLDFLLVGDAQARLLRSFVLDTQRLSDASLARAGLQREDSRASDHMPVVADLQRR